MTLLAALLLAASGTVVLVPGSPDFPAGAQTRLREALGDTVAVAAPAQLPCEEACAAGLAREAHADRAVVAALRSSDGALLLELLLVDAKDGRRLGRATAAALGLQALLAEIPRAVSALLRQRGGAVRSAAPPVVARAQPAAVAGKDTAWDTGKEPEPRARADDDERDREERRSAAARRSHILKERSSKEADGFAPALARIVEEVASDLEKARGLKRTRKLRYEVLDRKHFREALHARAVSGSLDERAATSTRWVAFGLARSLADPARIEAGVLDEDVLGFYDPKSRVLYVRVEQSGPEALAEEAHLRRVLAHEIEHALQDQNFGLELGKGDRDTRLARRALFEGDAMLAETAYEAMHSRRTARWMVARKTRALRSVDLISVAEENGYNDQLSSAPRIVQEEVIFPYVWGFGLVSDIFRRGGFAAVNQMFQHPPLSTGQVLDTDAFLSGRSEVEVPVPTGLPGKMGARGRLGTLGTKAALANCVDATLALDAARNLRGDAFAASRLSREDAVAVAWATAWKDADAAKVFLNLLEMQRPCWKDQTLAAGGGELFVNDDVYVAQEAERVVLVRGLPEAKAKAVADRALRFSSTPHADQPPFALDKTPLLADAGDEFLNGRFTSNRLSLRARVPEGFRAVPLNVADFAVASPEKGALGALSFIPEPPTDASRADVMHSYIGDVADWPGGLLEQSPRTGTLFGRQAEEHLWSAPNSPFRLRVFVLPVCKRKAFFAAVTAVRSDDAADKTMRAWLDTVALGSDEPPVCADLQEK